MKALSIRQPYAWLICNGYKDVENRTWSTSYRGPLLIHASGKPMSKAEQADFQAWCEEEGIPVPTFPLPTGGIVGMVTLTDCVKEDASIWFNGPIGWILEDPQPLTFFAVKGRLGLFDVEYPGL